jgi:predicted DNA binding CopG/RHH family protein
MPRTTTDPKKLRITVRISESDLTKLNQEAQRRSVKVGSVVRDLIRDCLKGEAL